MPFNPLKIAAGVGTVILTVLLLRWILRPVGKGGAHVDPVVDNSNLTPGVRYASYATDLYNAFAGVDWTSTKARAMQRTESLNDDEFKQVYKLYNQLYKDPPNTLKTDAQGEWIWGSIVTNFINRLERLNLP